MGLNTHHVVLFVNIASLAGVTSKQRCAASG
jgi:hypothetical protein